MVNVRKAKPSSATATNIQTGIGTPSGVRLPKVLKPLGTVTADDLTMRVSEAADGEDAVRQVLSFAQALSEATSRM